MDSSVVIRCKICGDVTVRSMTTVRSQHCVCHNCERIAKEKADAIKRTAKSNAQFERDAKTFNKGEQLGMKFCACGAPITGNQTMCRACAKRKQNRYANVKKERRRVAALTKESAQISVQTLYERDHGICWICGQLCDITADSNDNNYPSIDHVIPISKGGKDTWENVRLAHRRCNSVRGNRDKITQ